MPKNVTQYDLLISCPGDISEEIDIINKAVEQFNNLFSDAVEISIRSRHWSKSSYPQSGGKPQEILNDQFIKDCDAAVAVFWTRFGTATDKYESGSEEEIEIMLQSGKQVFMYFSNKPIPPDEFDNEQYEKVKQFKEKYRDKGVYSTYCDGADFEKQFFAHLSQHFLSLAKIAEINNQNRPLLNLKSIHSGSLHDVCYIEKFAMGNMPKTDEIIAEINGLFIKIGGSRLPSAPKAVAENAYGIFRYQPVELGDATKEIITEFAKAFQISIDDDFFSLGDLRRNSLEIPTVLGGGNPLTGTKEEEEKYNDIIGLRSLIEQVQDWFPIEKAFTNMHCIKLVLSNDGTTYDEDVDVELELDSEALRWYTEFEELPDDAIKYICDEISLHDVFEITETAAYLDYQSSKQSVEPFSDPSQNFSSWPYESRNYKDEYLGELENIFEYRRFRQDKSTILKLHIDYIKQNTAVAFPTPIFVNGECSSIKYRIRSKHNPTIVEAELETVSVTEL